MKQTIYCFKMNFQQFDGLVE